MRGGKACHTSMAIVACALLSAGCSSSSTRTRAAPLITQAPVVTPSDTASAAGPCHAEPVTVSWIGHRSGWLLDRQRCGSSPGGVSHLYKTFDVGRHWARRNAPTPKTTGIAFANGQVGYAYQNESYDLGGKTWVTRDGALSWQEIPGRATDALVVGGRWSYRVTYRGGGCPGPCHLRIERSITGSTAWHTVDVPPYAGDGANIAASGRTVLVTLPGNPAGGAGSAHSLYVESTDAGTTWHWHPDNDPCGGSGRHEWDTVATAIDHAAVAALCSRRLTQRNAMVVSNDHGISLSARRSVAGNNAGAIALIGDRIITASATTSGRGPVDYLIRTSDNRGATWTVAADDHSLADIYLDPVAKMQCVAGTCAYLADPRGLLVSTDSGRTWLRRAVPRG